MDFDGKLSNCGDDVARGRQGGALLRGALLSSTLVAGLALSLPPALADGGAGGGSGGAGGGVMGAGNNGGSAAAFGGAPNSSSTVSAMGGGGAGSPTSAASAGNPAEWGGGSGGGGTVFELSPAGGGWTYKLIYSLSGNSGPVAALSMDTAGNLYGTTENGGIYGFGNVFRLSQSNGDWTYTSLHDFTDRADGAYPLSNVVIDTAGNLYGTASSGGFLGPLCAGGCGVVWEITP